MTARSWAPAASAAVEPRYEIERKLGEGAAGAVYLARDCETGEQVALKKLFRMDAKSVLRLKREFRSLQALNHPHLVKLYDMGQAADAWFLTMEYLEGTDLTTYLNADVPDGPRLGSSFGQLARGIHALHHAGMLHRDLKPNNVFVVDDRVVVLDFGLVRELNASAATVTADGSVAGTPAYMAPEQIMAQELSAATDWYAFGVMLYEALSGVLPFEGSLVQLLQSKLESDPAPVEKLVPEAPRWLSDLCSALLRRNPLERPSGAQVLALFEAAQPHTPQPRTVTETVLGTETDGSGAPAELFGRTQEMKQLRHAFEQAQDGRTVVVHVRGASGAGKSALIEHFLDQLVAQDAEFGSQDLLVLRSRCYELETTPFKALDGVMDALTRHLSHLSDLEVAFLLPTDGVALAQVFPVLERLEPVQRLVANHRRTQDALQRRRCAETALIALLENLASRTPLVLWIDDLQWGDLDSARILKSWQSRSSTAPLLCVFSYRSDELDTSLCLQKLLRTDDERSPHAPEHTLDIAPLGAKDIQALCEQRLPAQAPGRAELIEHVVRDAQGSPFLASQLIALACAKHARGDTDLQALSIELMVAQITALLAADAQRLLEVLAVAGRPMLPKLALQATGLKRGGRALVHDLRTLNLVRTRDIAGVRMIEVYHDRIRERVQSLLSLEASRLIHQQLFTALSVSGQAEPDWLHTLALGAGNAGHALRYGSIAAECANTALAFERAVDLYRKCIELADPAESGGFWCKLSLTLARCGRGVEAAEAALEAAKHADADERVAWLERAATHLLRSGQYAQGEALVEEVLAAKRIDVPASDAGLTAAIVWERACIKLLGTRDVLRTSEAARPELLARFDLLGALFTAQSHDPLRAALFQARGLRCALQAGEPRRLVQALCSASTAAALYGSAQAARKSDALLARAEAVNAQLAQPDRRPVYVARAINAFMLGRQHEVLEPASEAERLFRADVQDDPGGNYFVRASVASVAMGALQYFGRHQEVATQLRSATEEAVVTDNQGLLLKLTLLQTRHEHFSGHAAWARPRLEAQRGELPARCFGVLHVLHMAAVVEDVCRTREYAWAIDDIERAWQSFLRSPVRHAAYLGEVVYACHAHLLLNQQVAKRRSGDPCRLVQTELAALMKLPQPSALAFAVRFRARAAFVAGDRETCLAQLQTCRARFAEIGMMHEATRDQYAVGVLLQGDEGASLRATAEQSMRDLGLADPIADLRACYPELFEAG